MDELKSILLVEDDEFIRELYKRQFEKAGFHIDAAMNGADGFALARENVYDLLLLDIMMPDMTGIDLLNKLRQEEKTKSTQVIFLTNLGQEKIMEEGKALGALGYLIKSDFTPDQLIEEVKKIVKTNSHILP
jgi:DNA-binding response OmpR family regulator